MAAIMPGCLHVVTDCRDFRIERLVRQILQLVPLRQLSLPTPEDLKDLQIQERIYVDVFANRPPPGTQDYRCKVLKKILEIVFDVCRDDANEISDNLVASLENLMYSKQAIQEVMEWSMPTSVLVQYSPPQCLSHRATDLMPIAEAINYYSGEGTTGHRTWEAALHLSYFLCCSGFDLVSGQKVLELGAGQGLVSYTCANVCRARHVIPTDGTESLVRNLIKTPATGGVMWTPWTLDWELEKGPGSLAELPREAKTDVGLILGADITFDGRLLPALLRTLDSLIKLNPRTMIYIAATVRNEQTLGKFEITCSK